MTAGEGRPALCQAEEIQSEGWSDLMPLHEFERKSNEAMWGVCLAIVVLLGVVPLARHWGWF